jgi:dTDP-4-amino-4,6-dideoxygalactose transaminase
MDYPIHVTRPSLAPIDDLVKHLETIWETGIMTHNGPLVQQLEKELCRYLDVKNVVCVANGTSALQLSLRALNLTGEVITTPFTFIATANIISWEHCCPVFVDIDPETWNIDVRQIEEKISDLTSAILPVHVFSAPCDVAQIQSIASRNGLKLIYDAAHAMATNFQETSVLNHGDISALSFHATKLFNTVEGGACVTNDDALAERVRRMRFFGFDSKKEIVDEGMNAKMTEVSAGLGLANLKYLDQVRSNRREKYLFYRNLLSDRGFLKFQKYNSEEYNYSYLPVLFESEEILLKIKERLESNNIFPQRYFHPSLNTVSIFQPQAVLPVAERVAKTVLCLPLFDTLPSESIDEICGLINI